VQDQFYSDRKCESPPQDRLFAFLVRSAASLERIEDNTDTLLRAMATLGPRAGRSESEEMLASELADQVRSHRTELQHMQSLVDRYRRDLDNLLRSRSYKAAIACSRILHSLLPRGSRHRGAVLRLWGVLRMMSHPRRLLRAIFRRGFRAAPGPGGQGNCLPLSVPVDPYAQTPEGLQKVVYLVNTDVGEWPRYRVKNLAEGLRRKGVRVSVIREWAKPEIIDSQLDADLLVIVRADLTARLARIMERFRKASVPIIYDIDDLLFEPESLQFIAAFNSLPPDQVEDCVQETYGWRAALLACDAATCPTAFLKSRIERLGKKAAVIRNTINPAQVARAQSAHGNHSERIRIGYFSGSKTHEKDFLEAANALLAVLAAHPQVDFHLVGALDLPPAFANFSSRVVCRGFMPYLDMLDCLAGVDINIAPLELKNPFTACKSELKIFEAALVGVPTVASAVDSYAHLISHGQDGYLARTEQEWTDSLGALVTDPGLRRRVGEAARNRFVPLFHIDHNAEQIISTYLDLKMHPPATPQPNCANLDIAWFVHSPATEGWGRTIYSTARHLAALGHRVTVYHFQGPDHDDLAHFVTQRVGALPHVRLLLYPGNFLHPHDVCFATDWRTAHALARHRQLVRCPFYFIQDVEPLLHPRGTDHLMAERAYRLGLIHVCVGPWPAFFAKAHYHADVSALLPSVRVETYSPGPRSNSFRTILFHSRPDFPGDCYDFGIEVLQRVKTRQPDVEVVLLGSPRIDSLKVPFEHVNLGSSLSPACLADLYRNADLGLVLSATNPGPALYDMMSCQTPVCVLRGEPTIVSFGVEDTLVHLDLDFDSAAERVLALLADDTDRLRHAHNGYRFVQQFPDDAEFTQRLEHLIVHQLCASAMQTSQDSKLGSATAA
jgi:glycosyltransferase involved in cell wall biosynthesis